jgi:hypothetical protein
MATLRIAADAVPALRMPAVSIADGSADPVPARLRVVEFHQFGRRLLDVPVDRATRRQLALSWRLRRIQLLIVQPLTLVAIALAVLEFVGDDPLPFSALLLAAPLVLVNGTLFGLVLWQRLPAARRLPGGDILVYRVHPDAAARWRDANPPHAVTILDW